MTINGVTDLFESERGVFAIALMLIATILLIIGKMSVEDWMGFAKWIAAALIASKTVTSAMEQVAKRKAPEASTE